MEFNPLSSTWKHPAEWEDFLRNKFQRFDDRLRDRLQLYSASDENGDLATVGAPLSYHTLRHWNQWLDLVGPLLTLPGGEKLFVKSLREPLQELLKLTTLLSKRQEDLYRIGFNIPTEDIQLEIQEQYGIWDDILNLYYGLNISFERALLEWFHLPRMQTTREEDLAYLEDVEAVEDAMYSDLLNFP